MGKFDSFLPSLSKVILAAAIMGMFLWFIFYRCDFLLGSNLSLAVKLGISILAGIAVYFGALQVFAREEARIFTGWISRRR